MTQDYYKTETTKRYNVPLAHLDYGYIRSCSDVKELENILRVLRSGDEGSYPELEKEAEGRLQQLNPKSRVLRKENPALQLSDLDKPERENLQHDLEAWKSDMADKEQMFSSTTVGKMASSKEQDFEEDSSLPPVRSSKVISVDGKVKESVGKSTDNSKKKKPLPRSYAEWDKIDIDKELEKTDEETPAKSNKDVHLSTFKPDRIAQRIDTEGMSDPERKARAVREKEKGNEAFHAHDFEESIVYYTRSISLSPLSATYNNRALAYLRLSKWDEVIKDCNYVLEQEPQNVKALLRRGTALKGKKDFAKARLDLGAALELESNNKTAQDLLKDIATLEEKAKQEAQKRKQSGRRMIIEEVDGGDEGEDEDVTEEIIVEKPDDGGKAAPLVNGHAEEAAAAGSRARAADQGQTTKAAGLSPVDPVPNRTTSPEREQHAETNKSTSLETNKDIWTEEDMEPAQQQQEVKASDQKSKLVATNILSDRERPQNGPGAKASQEGAAAGSTGSGDAATTDVEAQSESRQQTVASSGNTSKEENKDEGSEQTASSLDGRSEDSNSDEVSESTQNGEQDAEEKEAEPSHSRPVFVQKAFPPAEAVLREKGNNFFRCGQYPEAIQVYTEIISKLKTAADQVVNLSLIYSNRAACYLKIGDSRSAIADCGTSLELVPHSPKPLLRRAAAYEALEKYRLAYVDYKHALSIDRSTELAHQGASRCQHSLQNQDGPQWRQKLPPLIRISQWDVPEIIDELAAGGKVPASQPTKQPPCRATALKEEKLQSSEERQQKEVAKEEVPVKKVLSPEERFEEIKARGNKHVQKGEFEAAVQCYSQCAELFSDRVAVFTNRALCYLKLNKDQEAEEDCNRALALEPNNCKAFYRRALARKAQKHYKDSLQDLLQLLRSEPSNLAAKKEMELVKKLYKGEYDQLKAQPAPAEKKTAAKLEKKRKRMKIEEEADDSDTDEKDSPPRQTSGTKSSSAGTSQKPQTTSPSQTGNVHRPPTSHPTPHTPAASDKQATARTPETRKPGRGKSKKGGIKETSVGLPVTPPSAPKLQGKITPFEFIQHWNSLKQAKEIQPYVQLLEQISPDDLPGVISNKLDGHMLQIIARCAAHDAQTGEVERAYNILHNIRQVPRFSTVVMFLSNKEKQDIRKVLESMSSLGTRSAEEVAAVRKDYGLK